MTYKTIAMLLLIAVSTAGCATEPITRSREANAAILAGGAGAVAAATEAMPVIREGVGIMPVLSEALGRPALIAALVVMAAALAIWVWRRQRLLEQGA